MYSEIYARVSVWKFHPVNSPPAENDFIRPVTLLSKTDRSPAACRPGRYDLRDGYTLSVRRTLLICLPDDKSVRDGVADCPRPNDKRDANVFCITAPRKGICEIRSTVARLVCPFCAHIPVSGAYVYTRTRYMHVRIYRIRLYGILFNANTAVNDNGGTRPPPIDLNNNASSPFATTVAGRNNINCSFYTRRHRRRPGQNCSYLPETVIFYYFISPVSYILLFARVGTTKSAPTRVHAGRTMIIMCRKVSIYTHA